MKIKYKASEGETLIDEQDSQIDGIGANSTSDQKNAIYEKAVESTST